MRILNTTICLLLLLGLSACSGKQKSYISYNDRIVAQAEQADSTLRELFKFSDLDNYPEQKAKYTSSLAVVYDSLSAVIPEFEDDTLRQTALELVATYQQIAEVDFLSIHTLMTDSIYTIEDSLRVDSLSAEMYAKWQIQSERFATAQQHFSKKYKIELYHTP